MNPDLVGPPGMELQPEKVDNVEPRHHRGIGPRRPAGGGHDHPLPVLLVAADGGIDMDRALIQVTPCQGRVAPAHPAGGNGGPEPAVSDIGLGYDHEARCVPVQPMDDAGATFRPTGQGGTPCDQGIHQGVVPVPWCRVNHQARGFVDDGQMLILEDEGKRYSAGLERARRLMLENANGDLLTTGEESGGAGGLAVYRYQLISYQAGGLRAGEAKLISEESIQTLSLSRDYSEIDVPVGTASG